MSDLIGEGFGSTLEEIGEARMGSVMMHLAYLRDMAAVERMRDDAASGRRSY